MLSRLAVASLLLFLSSCVLNRKESSTSFAHVKGNIAVSTPIGFHKLSKDKLKSNIDKLKFCVQNKTDVPNDLLILEVKLAYVFWFKASETINNQDWQSFEFVIRESCEKVDEEFTSVIAIMTDPQFEKYQLGPKSDVTFEKPVLNCQKTESLSTTGNKITSTSCSTAMDLGLGGTGAASILHDSVTGDWISLKREEASFTVLSPFAKWISLFDHEFTNAERISKFEKIKSSLIESKGKNLEDFDPIIDFFTSEKILIESRGIDKTIIKSFQESDEKEITKEFTPESYIFHVLLHEVGHQFGMSHADNPSLDGVTGQSSTATINDKNQWVTKESTMAYGEPYGYLTEDDILGIKSQTKQIEDILAKKKMDLKKN